MIVSKYSTQNNMKIKKEDIERLVRSELNGNIQLSEELTSSDIDMIRELIRREISLVFFTLFKKRSVWV